MSYGFVDISDEEEIINAFIDGTPACECGECMQPIGDSDTVRCPTCGAMWDIIEYATTGPFSDILSEYIEEYQPEGCKFCGHSAWPKCKTSCGLFDD